MLHSYVTNHGAPQYVIYVDLGRCESLRTHCSQARRGARIRPFGPTPLRNTRAGGIATSVRRVNSHLASEAPTREKLLAAAVPRSPPLFPQPSFTLVAFNSRGANPMQAFARRAPVPPPSSAARALFLEGGSIPCKTGRRAYREDARSGSRRCECEQHFPRKTPRPRTPFAGHLPNWAKFANLARIASQCEPPPKSVSGFISARETLPQTPDFALEHARSSGEYSIGAPFQLELRCRVRLPNAVREDKLAISGGKNFRRSEVALDGQCHLITTAILG